MPAPSNGILRKSSNRSVQDTVEKLKRMLDAKGVKLFCLSGSQRRGRKSWHENARREVVDLWQPAGRYPIDAGGTDDRYRSPPENSGFRG